MASHVKSVKSVPLLPKEGKEVDKEVDSRVQHERVERVERVGEITSSDLAAMEFIFRAMDQAMTKPMEEALSTTKPIKVPTSEGEVFIQSCPRGYISPIMVTIDSRVYDLGPPITSVEEMKTTHGAWVAMLREFGPDVTILAGSNKGDGRCRPRDAQGKDLDNLRKSQAMAESKYGSESEQLLTSVPSYGAFIITGNCWTTMMDNSLAGANVYESRGPLGAAAAERRLKALLTQTGSMDKLFFSGLIRDITFVW